MRTATYVGAICGRQGNYGIMFPDFLGCASAADTLTDVTREGREALQFHIDGMDEDGEAIPEPREWTLAQVAQLLEDDGPEPWDSLVRIDVEVPEPADRVTIDIPAPLARELDAVTQNRKRFIIDAARRELLRLKASA